MGATLTGLLETEVSLSQRPPMSCAYDTVNGFYQQRQSLEIGKPSQMPRLEGVLAAGLFAMPASSGNSLLPPVTVTAGVS